MAGLDPAIHVKSLYLLAVLRKAPDDKDLTARYNPSP
jgi:hypothetical protein